MNRSALRARTSSSSCLLLVGFLVICLTPTASSFCLQGARPLLPRTHGDAIDALGPTTGLASLKMSDDDKDNKSQPQGKEGDAAALQAELDEMFPAQEEDEDLQLYNAAPLFTGGIITVVSLAFTAYLFYAGLTGDDPLMGHPK